MQQDNALSSSSMREDVFGRRLSELWRQKMVILTSTLLCLGVGCFYLYQSTPIYEASTIVVSPTSIDIAPLNAGLPLKAGMMKISPLPEKFFYTVLIESLMSVKTKRAFFDASTALLGDLSYDEFNRFFIVREVPCFLPGKHLPRYSVTVRGFSPTEVVDWASRYLLFAQKNARMRLADILILKQKQALQHIDQQMNMLRQTTKLNRLNRISQLREALSIAQSLHLEQDTGRREAPLYQLGSRALLAEIEVLTGRESEDAFVKALPTLQAQKRLLQQWPKHIDDLPLSYRLDDSITASEHPVSPRIRLTVILSLCFGLSLGTMVALFRILRGDAKMGACHDADGLLGMSSIMRMSE
jgi:chain length determinant protein (polysaccharide antigen chain regulator)